MAEKLFMVNNSSQPTTAAPVSQPTGTAIRTMLQLEAGANNRFTVVEWGISFDGSAAATPIKVELFGTTVAATMSTAFVAADLMPYNDANVEASNLTLGGTTHSGFATAAVTEGTVANYRAFDTQLIAPTSQYWKQFPLGREPVVAVGTGKFLRVRVTAGASVNAYIYVVWAE